VAEPVQLLVVLTAPPYGSDLVTTVFRLVHTALRHGATVRVWACGYATMLTRQALGQTKPANPRDWSRQYPTTAALVAELAGEPGFGWLVCRFCANDRGADQQIPQVRMVSPFRIGELVTAAANTVYIGGA
jgi:sulfur relay (sulfurtransferase) complex TusBCD TusD component (DsrE family)